MKKIDRTGWTAGPWEAEPDRVEWVSGGFYCQCNRNRHGVWCGYIGVPEGHPWHGVGYDDVHQRVPDLEVHGGLTFANKFGADQAAPNLWGLGFDCAHAWDIMPGMTVLIAQHGYGELGSLNEVYQTLPFAMGEVLRLVAHANGDAPFFGPVLIRIVDGDEVRVGPAPGKIVSGDGAAMLCDFVRGTGTAHIGVALDWLEDHPEFVADTTAEEMASIMARLREQHQPRG